MAERRRVNVRKILANPDLRRELMVPAIQAIQAREGIETTREQAERAYLVVTEGEKATFFDLERFRGGRRSAADLRERTFVEALSGAGERVRFDIARRDFGYVEGSVLAFRNLAWLAPIFRQTASLMPQYGRTRSGLNTTDIDRFSRLRWESSSVSGGRRWVMFAKGGDFSRFYTDHDLVFDWTDDGAAFKQLVASKYGSASRFVKSEEDYFRAGITWVQTTVLGINARLVDGAIFGVASPTLFLDDESNTFPMLGVMNSTLFDALARCLATRNWGATAIGSIPVPPMREPHRAAVADCAQAIHDAKASWDQGNEISGRFSRPWILRDEFVAGANSISARLEALSERERADQDVIKTVYAQLNDEVFALYGIPDATRKVIEEGLGGRPPEVLWPQMEGKTTEQKRMEHVWRVLSYAVKRVLEADDDGIVPFGAVNAEPKLVDRLRQELAGFFPGRDPNQVEVETVNELKKMVKGYRKCASLDEWLDNAFFEYHCGLYKNRPIFWHIASAQGTGRVAFGALVSYHRFDKNRMAKLRSSYLRDAIEEFRRETGLADKAGRSDDRVEWQAKVEESQALDKKLQLIQEGHHEGADGDERDYRILTPWKESGKRPKGWDPDLDDGVKVNIGPFERAGVLRIGGII